MQRFGYNIDAGAVRDKAALMAHLAATRPSVVLVMDGLGLADEIYRLLGGETIVIHRTWSSLEGNEWRSRTPEQFIAQWKTEGFKHIVRYASANEPQFGGVGSPERLKSIQDFVAHGVSLMQQARQNGFTLCFGNFSVGSYEKSEVQSGLFDLMLRAINSYQHLAGSHEYTTGLLPFGVGKWGADALMNPLAVQFDRWPKASALPTAKKADGSYPDYWHLRRFDWFLLRCDELRISRPAVVLTEGLWDYMGDVEGTLAKLRQSKGMGEFGNVLRGVLTYKNLWDWYFPGISFGEIILDQLDWAQSIYPPEYIGITLFGWNSRWYKQRDKEGHDWSAPELATFRQLFEIWAQTGHEEPNPTPVPPPAPNPNPSFPIPPFSNRDWLWTKVRANHAGKTRVRATPVLAADNTIGWIEPVWKNAKLNPKAAIVNGKDTATGKLITWMPLKVDGVLGWAAVDYFEIHSERVPLHEICD